MRHPLERLRSDVLVPWGVGATIFAFACGSSSVHAIAAAGRTARWAMLLALLVLALACAASRRARRPLTPLAAAAAAAFIALALVSAGWSVEPRLSFERAVSIGLVFAAATLLAAGTDAERVLAGVVAGAVAVAVAGLLLLAVDHSVAVAPASYEVPARYQGLGENPNTAPLLLSLALPVALAAAFALRDRLARAAAAASVVLLLGSIVASGSRGGLAAAAVGSLLVCAVQPGARRRLAAAGAVVVVALAGAYVESIPKPLAVAAGPAVRATSAPAPTAKPAKRPRYLDADSYYPLDADVGGPLPGGGQPTLRRTFFASSGRVAAWRGAIAQAAERPALGFGFGTESDVFVDRYYYFVGGLPENAYIGIALQLGLVGLGLILLLFVALARTGVTALARGRPWPVVAALGVLAAGLVDGVVQSYFYSAGDIATLALWSSIFLLPAAAWERR